MPTTRTVQTASMTAAAPTVFTADATGDKFAIGSGPVFMRISNANGSSQTCTVDDPNSVTPEGATAWNPDVVITIPNATTRVVKISDGRRFGNAADSGLVSLAWSAATGMTFELYQ